MASDRTNEAVKHYRSGVSALAVSTRNVMHLLADSLDAFASIAIGPQSDDGSREWSEVADLHHIANAMTGTLHRMTQDHGFIRNALPTAVHRPSTPTEEPQTNGR